MHISYEYIRKLVSSIQITVFLTFFAKVNDNKMFIGGVIVDYPSDFQIYDWRTTTVGMS